MNNIDFLYKVAENYQGLSDLMVKISFIKKLKNGKYRVTSRSGKNLGTYSTKSEAKKRLKQVEMFKHLKKEAKEKKLDLKEIESFSYSSIMRKINKQLDQSAAKEFASIYKKIFDKKILSGDNEPEKETLEETVLIFKKKYPIELDEKIKKKAEVVQVGSAVEVARYLSNIIKFTLNKISAQKRPKSIQRLKEKLSKLDILEMSNKKMPASSAMGQSITFVKHTLFGQNPKYIRDVLYYIVRGL